MTKTIVVASDSFKGSLTSEQVGVSAAAGVAAAGGNFTVKIVSVADGGEGTVDAIVAGLGGKIVTSEVTGPLGKPVNARYGIAGETAIIEVAAACGLTLVDKSLRNPMVTTTYGVGQLIKDALGRGCRKFLIGLGGSSTNDGGTGMLSALGYRFIDREGNAVTGCGGNLDRIVGVDATGALKGLRDAKFTVACDVKNQLTGKEGASYVFAPQKGADEHMVERLDKGLVSFAAITKEIVDSDYSNIAGSGAAGGLGFSFLAYLDGQLCSGIDMVLDAIGFDSLIKGASLVITGEGRLDRQTCMGKTPFGILTRARKQGIPVIAIGGSIEDDAVNQLIESGFSAVFPIVNGPCELSTALSAPTASRNVARTVEQIIRSTGLNL